MSCSWCIFALHDYLKLHSIIGRLLDFSRPLEECAPAPLSRSRNERLINSAQVGKSIRIVRCISMENIQNNTKTPTGRAPTMAKEYKWSSVRSYRSVSRVAKDSLSLACRQRASWRDRDVWSSSRQTKRMMMMTHWSMCHATAETLDILLQFLEKRLRSRSASKDRLRPHRGNFQLACPLPCPTFALSPSACPCQNSNNRESSRSRRYWLKVKPLHTTIATMVQLMIIPVPRLHNVD